MGGTVTRAIRSAVQALDACLAALEHIDRNANLGLVIQHWCEELAGARAKRSSAAASWRAGSPLCRLSVGDRSQSSATGCRPWLHATSTAIESTAKIGGSRSAPGCATVVYTGRRLGLWRRKLASSNGLRRGR